MKNIQNQDKKQQEKNTCCLGFRALGVAAYMYSLQSWKLMTLQANN